MSNETILFVVICFLVLILIIFSVKLGQAHYKIEKQKLELTRINFANELSILSARLTAAASTNKKPQISKTTEQLLNLAVKATNEGEAAAAAKQACRKLYKELGYK